MQVTLDPGMAKGLLLYIPGRRLIVEYSLLMSADPGMADPRKVIVAYLKSDDPCIEPPASLDPGIVARSEVDCSIFILN